MNCKGKWAQAALLAVGTALCLARSHAAEVVVSVQSVACAPGGTAIAWITLENAADITGADLSLRLPDFATAGPAQTTDASAGFLIASRARPGQIDIAIASATALSVSQGTVLGIPISVHPAANPGLYSLNFDRLRIYDNAPAPTSSRAVAGLLAVTPPPPDRDADGLPDDWETAFFMNTAGTADDDPDGDGASNAREFIAGTDPTRADSVFAIDQVTVDRHQGSVTLGWTAQANRTYDIEWSDDPPGPEMAWHQVYHPVIEENAIGARWIDDGSRTFALPSVPQQRFYRIRIRLP